jgi:hypothetical protein
MDRPDLVQRDLQVIGTLEFPSGTSQLCALDVDPSPKTNRIKHCNPQIGVYNAGARNRIRPRNSRQ